MSAEGGEGRLKVVVGITGGIAAYKAVSVVRGLVLEGHDVHVIATPSALRFVGLPTLEAISRHPVGTDLFEGVSEVTHVALGQSADVIVVVPATAGTIAKLAHGLSDDLLGTTVLASTAPVVVAPAMHTEMWRHPATEANIALLRHRGVHVIDPEDGPLTGGDTGPGRLADPDRIVAEAILAARDTPDLRGRRILVTAGGTREPLDPVRYLGNRSSGKQGTAIVRAALQRGAAVTLVAAHLDVPVPPGAEVRTVGTADEMLRAVEELAPAHDVVIMAAAVADYRPATVSEGKIKKDATGEHLTLELERTPDVLATVARRRRGDQTIVGFAAETEPDRENLLAGARAKRERKSADLLVVNRVGWSEGFGADRNSVVVVGEGGAIVMEASGSKLDVAHRLLDLLL